MSQAEKDGGMDPRGPGRLRLFQKGLEARAREDQLRSLKHYRPEIQAPYVLRDGVRLLNFSSNDYLGLATDPEVREGAASFARMYGAGATASRLVSGGLEIHEALEAELATFTRRGAALLFNSGYQANTSVLPALVDRSGLILCDRRSHHSILQGAVLSRAKLLRFEHNDPDHLEALLTGHGQGHRGVRLIVTESIFSMDGDRAPLAEISEVAERHGALLLVDDAHAIGVWGPRGEGLAAGHERVDIVLGTFGKAFGASGAFVASAPTVQSHLVNFCGGFIYSTAPPPGMVGAVRVALGKVRSGELRQDLFIERVAEAHERLRRGGVDTSPSDTQIVPIALGAEQSALDCAAFLEDRGILAVAIRPPTVPPGTSRLRVSLCRHHTDEHLAALVDTLSEFRSRAPRRGEVSAGAEKTP
ncbi:MAG: 8-amino-7-oxononanoate synthase [Gemmatimonadetes bacterium]|nr:8-amino-7-oxononanoate synthase [Gemmatimonadota bacterium]